LAALSVGLPLASERIAGDWLACVAGATAGEITAGETVAGGTAAGETVAGETVTATRWTGGGEPARERGALDATS
jgi:hypothetical protein